MDREELITYCLALPGAEETYPFGEGELVAKVGGKAFAFIGLGAAARSVTLKCGRTEEEAAIWRDRFPDAIAVSAYIGRYGWNAVRLDGPVPAEEMRELIDDSYAAIVAKLPKSRRPTPA